MWVFAVATLFVVQSQAQRLVEVPAVDEPYFPEREAFSPSDYVIEEDLPLDTDIGLEEVPLESDLGYEETGPAFNEDAGFVPDYTPERRVLFVIPRTRPFGFSPLFNRFFGQHRPVFPRMPQLPSFDFVPRIRPTTDHKDDQNDTALDFPSLFGHPNIHNAFPSMPFPSLFGPPRPHDDESEANETSILFPGFDHPIFESMPDFDSLPGNYSNSTHDIHDIDGKKVVVNQTIEKSSGPGFHNFFHFKVIHHAPGSDDEDTVVAEDDGSEVLPEIETDLGRGDTPFDTETPEDTPYVEDPLVDEAENEIRIPKKLVQDKDEARLARHVRTISHPSGNPRSYDNHYSYGNRLDHDVSEESKEEDSEYMPWAKPKKNHNMFIPGGVRPIRPHDLSRDTRVNSIAASSGGHQQGMSLVDPDAEVFDLDLVLKEHASHDV